MSEETNTTPDPDKVEIKVFSFGVVNNFTEDKAAAFKGFISDLKGIAQQIFDTEVHVPPAAFFVLNDGNIYLLELGKYLAGGYDMVADVVRSIVKSKQDPEIYGTAILIEATTAEVPKDDQRPVNELNDLTVKEEIVMINAQSKEYSVTQKIPIVRTETSVTLGETSEFTGMFLFMGKHSFFQ